MVLKTNTCRRLFHIGSLSLLLIAFFRCLSLGKGSAITRFKFLHSAKMSNGKIGSYSLSRRADWEAEDGIPQFCQRIMSNPKPFKKGCHRNISDMSCIDIPGETIMFSQFHQDYYLYTRHFINLKRQGTYIDIASNDPISISNTYFFDRCLQWKGVCVEGNHVYFEPTYRYRSCQLVPTCVGSRDGQFVTFGLHGGAGGVLGDTYKSTKRLQKLNQTIDTITERCTTMELVLKREGITEIDFLSLDVEGHELEVLKGFGLDSVIVKVMTIEVTGSDLSQIEAFLENMGYKRHYALLETMNKIPGLLHEDAVFLHESVTWGDPQ